MSTLFTVDEARALLPAIRERADAIVSLRADLAEISHAVGHGETASIGGVPELKGVEARLHEHVSWLTAQGVQLKGIAPMLVDFRALLGGREVLLCWLEGEVELSWYHLPEHGFMGRRRLDAGP